MPDDDNKDKKQDPPASRAATAVERMIAKHGSAEAALSVVMAQNIAYSDQAESDAATIADLKKQLPGKDAVVLTGERAKAFNAFEALKLTPEQVSETVKERDTLRGTVKLHDLEKLVREGAPALGFDPDAVADLVTSKGLHAELREVEIEVEKNGKKEKQKVKAPFVRPAAEEKAQLVSLAEYAQKLPAFEQRALKAVPTQQTTTAQGVPWPVQRPADKTPAGGNDGLLKQFQKARDQVPNPLLPQKQTATTAA